MNWLHGFWDVGATTGPFIMGLALASSAGWTSGAQTIGFIQLSLAVVLALSLPLWAKEHSKPPAGEAEHCLPGQFKPVRTAPLWL